MGCAVISPQSFSHLSQAQYQRLLKMNHPVALLNIKVTSCKGIRFPDSGNFCLWNPARNAENITTRNRFSPGAPTPKRPQVDMSYRKRRARRRKRAGAKEREVFHRCGEEGRATT